MKLEDIKNHAIISGIEPNESVRIISTEPVGDNALTVYYKRSGGALLERMLFRTDEANLRSCGETPRHRHDGRLTRRRLPR